MHFTIAMATAGLPLDGHSLEKKALGGSETAFICMAKALAKRGHTVHAFANCPNPSIVDGVAFYPLEQFPSQAAQLPYDIVISSRWPEVLRSPCNEGLRILWCHDTLEDTNRFMGNLYRTDLVFLLSQFHLANYKSKCDEVDKFSWVTSNGVDLDLCKSVLTKPTYNAPIKRLPKRLLFTSRPERGLHHLLGDIFPLVVKEIPDVEICYCNYPLDGMKVPDHVKEITQFCDIQTRQFPKNITNLGHLTKERLYEEMSKASVLAYPTNFPEISCISIMEAQACGLPVVSTNDFALPETLHPAAGVLIDGKPPSSEYIEKFARAVIDLLNDPERRIEMGRAGIAHVESKYSWDAVAESWEQRFMDFLESRYRERTSSVAKQLQRHGDFLAASTIADCGRLPAQTFPLPTAAEEVLRKIREAMPRLEAAAQIISASGIEPKSILDYGCGYVCFGLVAAKYFPTAEVTLTDTQEQPLNQARANIERVQLPNVQIRDISAAMRGKQYEIIYLGNLLEFQTTPSTFLQSLRDSLTDNGYFLISCEAGPLSEKAGVQAADGTRLWNLTHREFRDLFAECADFKCLFVELGKNALGEPHGHWVALISKKGLNGEPVTFQKIDLKKKRILTRPYESLSVCVITNEQEENIGAMLKSVSPIADEIIVVDTRKSNSDKTIEIAERFGSKVIVVPFDNFSQVRNESLKAATSDWILWIDTDEKLMGVDNLRQYMIGAVYEGFALRQIHFTVDGLNGTFDIPLRIFRNREHYRFTGLIHEHGEDTSKGKYDNPITPRMMLPDVDIAHFGYLNEDIRRTKCSNRNMALLKRAVDEQPDRKLTWTLVIRDYLNMIKWDVPKISAIERGSHHHKMLESVVDMFHKHFPNPDSKYYAITFPMYQEALMVLGSLSLPYKENKLPPFEVRLTLTASMAASYKGELPGPEVIWFLDYEEFKRHFDRKLVQAGVTLGLLDKASVGDALTKSIAADVYGAPTDASAILGRGIGAYK